MTSTTNENQLKARKQQAARDRLTDEIITKMLMSTQDGRRWVWLRLSEASVFTEDTEFDVGWMAFRKGVRMAALRLLSDVSTFTPTEYILMTQEASRVQLIKEDTDGDRPDLDS